MNRRDLLTGGAFTAAAAVGSVVVRPKLTTPTVRIAVETRSTQALAWNIYDADSGKDISADIPAKQPTVAKLVKARVGDSFYARRWRRDADGRFVFTGEGIASDRVRLILVAKADYLCETCRGPATAACVDVIRCEEPGAQWAERRPVAGSGRAYCDRHPRPSRNFNHDGTLEGPTGSLGSLKKT